MRKHLLVAAALVFAAVLALGLTTGVSHAQDRCFGDVVNYLACFQSGDLRIWHIDGTGQGHEVGVLPAGLFRYAAAAYEAPQLVTRLVSPEDGSAVDVYFTGKLQLNPDLYETTWSLVIYDANGTALATAEFAENASPSMDAVPSFASVPAGGGAGESGSTSAPAPILAAPYSGEFEPVIVEPGTVQECLVRTTYSVRMREAPTTASPILDTVPYNTSMPSDLHTVDGQWARAFYVGEGGVGHLGWIYTRYLDLSEACENTAGVLPLGGGAAATAAAAPTTATATVPEAESGEEAAAPEITYPFDLTIVEPGTVQQCLVRNTYTVRMRAAPTTDAPVLGNVPYNTAMPSDLRTTDNGWYRAFFVGEGGVGHLGWIDADFLAPSEACAGLSAINPIP